MLSFPVSPTSSAGEGGLPGEREEEQPAPHVVRQPTAPRHIGHFCKHGVKCLFCVNSPMFCSMRQIYWMFPANPNEMSLFCLPAGTFSLPFTQKVFTPYNQIGPHIPPTWNVKQMKQTKRSLFLKRLTFAFLVQLTLSWNGWHFPEKVEHRSSSVSIDLRPSSSLQGIA